MEKTTIHNELVREAIFRFHENTPRIEKCLEKLSEQDIWERPNASSNSIANLILHLCGNITQYILSSMGGMKDIRVRDHEFKKTGGLTKYELIGELNKTVTAAVDVIRMAETEELLRTRIVQGFNMSGIAIILHVLEHYSYHTGQIVLLTKLKINQDMAFYAGVDLNIKNPPTGVDHKK